MTKGERQDRILRIVAREHVHTQEQLAALLAKEGVQATQVTLSRDIREIGLVKGPRGYQLLEADRPAEALGAVLAGHLMDARPAQNMVVLKTAIGHAQPIAAALDREEWSEVLGTLAGDDTILVVTADSLQAEAVAGRLLGLVGRGGKRPGAAE